MKPRYMKLKKELWSDEATGLLNMLISHLVGDKSRLRELGSNQISYADIPTNLKFQRLVLKAIEECDAQGLPPTETNIATMLLPVDGEAPRKLSELLLEYRTIDGNVKALAAALTAHIRRLKRREVLEQINDILDRDDLDEWQQWEQASRLMNSIAPERRSHEVRPFVEDLRDTIKHIQDNYEKGIKGINTGFRWPWPELCELVPVLKQGEMGLISAKPGHGKTTIGMTLAVHGLTNGFYVVYYAFENTRKVLAGRYIAGALKVSLAHLLYPVQPVVRDGELQYLTTFNPLSPEWEKQLERVVLHAQSLKDKTGGELYIEESSGWNTTRWYDSVLYHATRAQRLGRPLLVINDYYSLLDGSPLLNGRSESLAARNNAVADWLKNVTEELGCYTINLAQDNLQTEYDQDEMPWNGQQIYQRSQVYIRIERGVAHEDLPVTGNDGRPVKDKFGKIMYLHRADGAAAQSVLHVLKANDGVRGYVPVLIPAYAYSVLSAERGKLEEYLKISRQKRKGSNGATAK